MLCCNWYGPSPPAVDLPELREPLRLSHGVWANKPLAGWCSDDVPVDAVYIGTILPLPEEGKMGVHDGLDWNYLRLQALRQWEWDHDREGLLARDKAEEAQIAREYYEEEAKRRKELTLEKLAKHKFLALWEAPIPQVAIRTSRRLLRDTAKELALLGEKPTVKSRMNVLRACIEGFNALDAKHEFIGTAEREDICDDFNLPLGRLRCRAKGSSGGQKGLEDIFRTLGTEQLARIRIGIGPPPDHWDVTDFVLSKFKRAQRPLIQQTIERAADAAADWVRDGIEACMNRFNADPTEPE